MSNHLIAIIIKMIVLFVVLFAVLGLGFDVNIFSIIILSILLAVVSYLVGDLLISSRSKNIVATAVDLVLSFATIWLIGLILIVMEAETLALAAIISAVIIAVFEYFFHIYVRKYVLNADNNPETTRG